VGVSEGLIFYFFLKISVEFFSFSLIAVASVSHKLMDGVYCVCFFYGIA